MAFSKADLFGKKDVRLAEVCKALAHPARVAIVKGLEKNGTQTVAEMTRDLPLSQPTLSQHIKVLREAQLIVGIEQPPFIVYQINSQLKKKAALLEAIIKL